MQIRGIGVDAAREMRSLLRLHAPAGSDLERLGVRPEDLSFEELGFDSIRLVQFVLACEKSLGVSLPGEILLRRPLTVGTLLAEAEHALAQQG